MASAIKKRKLDGQSQAPPLSAFAARRTLKVEATGEAVPIADDPNSHRKVKEVSAAVTTISTVGGNEVSYEHIRSSVPETLSSSHGMASRDASQVPLSEEDDDSSSRVGSPELLLEAPAVVFSTFKPTRANTQELEDGTLHLRVAPGERLILLGECDISVIEGRITIMGATLQASKRLHRFYASSSHSLPIIRCLASEITPAEIQLYQCRSGLQRLGSLSPLFDKMWNDGSACLSIEYKSLVRGREKSSYQILFTSKDGPPKAFLQPIISAPEWNKVLSKFSYERNKRPPAIMISGPKSSGKSTFAKILTNKLISDAEAALSGSTSNQHLSPGVALLDLDPGQPEYSIPGQLSLAHIQEPNLGPPFSHPWPGGKSRLIRCHTIGAITPAQDPDLYMQCALDLAAHYHNLLSQYPGCPLVINTPGWVLGTGLELLVELITKLRPTGVVYMSHEGPWDVVNSLRSAAKSIPVYTLPSQTCEYTTRTAAHLRTMQTMSYFHLNPSGENALGWSSIPLTAVPPWEIKYSGEGPGILGVLSYGEQPSAECIMDSINGSVVAIVVIDDVDAIPGLRDNLGDNGSDHEDENEYIPASNIHRPLIIRSPDSDLPYFNPLNSITISPQHSHCIGLALVRGVDVTRRRLQVLTPLPPSTIEEINEQGKRVVLVSGKFDTPGWAYTQDMVKRTAIEKDGRKGKVGEEESDEDFLDICVEPQGLTDFTDLPWVETLEGSQGRGLGSRVWRVRRDLGRQDGGE